MFAPTGEDIRFFESLHSKKEILDSSVIDRYEAYIESQHEEASRRIVAERRAEKRGITHGKALGRDEEKRANARNMLGKGIAPDVIARVTGLSAEEIAAL